MCEIEDCLKDIGCDEVDTMQFRSFLTKHEQYKFLLHKRRHLLEQLHTTQSQIDCLDYLIKKVKV